MALPDVLPNCAAANEFHRKVGLRPETCVRHTCVIDLSDAGMLQSGEGLRFLLKTPKRFGVGHTGLDDLESHRAPRMLLFRFVNSTHPALADQPLNSVLSNDCVPRGDARRLLGCENDLGISEPRCGLQAQFNHAARATSAENARFRNGATTVFAPFQIAHGWFP